MICWKIISGNIQLCSEPRLDLVGGWFSRGSSLSCNTWQAFQVNLNFVFYFLNVGPPRNYLTKCWSRYSSLLRIGPFRSQHPIQCPSPLTFNHCNRNNLQKLWKLWKVFCILDIGERWQKLEAPREPESESYFIDLKLSYYFYFICYKIVWSFIEM